MSCPGCAFPNGSKATWKREARGGYGYVDRIPVDVVRHSEKRVLVVAPLANGGSRRVWVRPEHLEKRA